LFHRWQRDLAEIGPQLPAQPERLPTAEEYLGS